VGEDDSEKNTGGWSYESRTTKWASSLVKEPDDVVMLMSRIAGYTLHAASIVVGDT
jgi:hypothetical protein